MISEDSLTVVRSPNKPKRRVLLTTAVSEGVVPFFQNRRRHKVRISEVTDRRQLLELCMNAEIQLDFEWPFGGIHILKENVPSMDILDYPTMDEYEARLNEGKYDVVAFSFYRFNIPQIKKMVALARNYGVQEVWAGNYGANSPELNGVFDRTFPSDGVEAMKGLVEGTPLEYRRHPLLQGTTMKGVPVGYLYTSVGCRYLCKFCPTTTFMPDPFYTPIEEIRRVLDVYVRNGVQSITILDETFLQDREHSNQVIEELRKRELIWHCTSRVTLLRGRIKELRESGLRSIYTGVETLTNENLKSHSKGQSVSIILDLFKELNDIGMVTTMTYILGFETDTAESILEAGEIIRNELRPFCLSLLVLTPHTNSQIETVESRIFDHDPTHYDSQHLVWEHPHLTPEDIYELLWITHRDTVHPRNLVKKRIIERMKAVEAGAPPLFSERVTESYGQWKGRPPVQSETVTGSTAASSLRVVQ